MAMNLMAKKFSQLPIGTYVELVYCSGASSREKICGRITDSDFSQNVEITTDDGKVSYQNFSSVLNFQVTKPAEPEPEKPQKPEQPEKPEKPAEPEKKAEPLTLSQKKPADMFCVSDNELRRLFDTAPKADRQKLSAAFDSFRYGVKINDRAKMADAAGQASQILFREDKNGHYWSTEAAKFCGILLHRAQKYDPEAFLVGACFWEAALTCLRTGDQAMAGAYALLAMLEPEAEHVQDLVILLAGAMVRTDDASALRLLYENLPTGFESHLRALIREAFAAKGIRITETQRVEDSLNLLETLYPNHAIADEVACWLPEEEPAKPAPVSAPAPKVVVASAGLITKLNWSESTGVITCDNGATCTFRYQDIAAPKLRKAIDECLRTDLGGKLYLVKFDLDGGCAKNIRADEAIMDRARVIFANPNRPERFETAYKLAKLALETTEDRRALPDLVRYAMAIYAACKDISIIREALDLCQANLDRFPMNAGSEMELVQCYSYVQNYAAMSAHTDKALACPDQAPRQKTNNLAKLIRLYRTCWETGRDSSLPKRILERTRQWESIYRSELSGDRQHQSFFRQTIRPTRIMALCAMNQLSEAEAEFAKLASDHPQYRELSGLMEDLRSRVAPKVKTTPQPEPVQPEPAPEPAPAPDEAFETPAEEEIPEEIPPYTDTAGWEALNLTKGQVIDYALNIPGPDRTGPMLAYLKAAANLNPDIAPVYHTVALAANDPMDAPDYSITALVNALADSDADYPQLTDCCMAAAFLRASFLSGRGYGYSAQGLRDSIAITQKLPALREAYDTLESFRTAAGWPIDIYADYRNHGVKKLNGELDALVRRAGELYNRFVLTAPREGASLLRLIETKKLLFARDGYLATMLRHIMERSQAALEAEKDAFATNFLGGAAQFSAQHISALAVDSMIAESWDLAGRNMQARKLTANLQGTLRNNLRSSISEILGVICQWYSLSAQSAGLTWRTAEGEEAYRQLKPRLLDQLTDLDKACAALTEDAASQELRTGLFLLASAARELSARLDGTWNFDQEKYLYADFLRTGHVMLDENFLPELDSTFCALPDFNILARIRAHVEGEKLPFQARIDRIYSKDKTCNNYGAARQIQEYLDFLGQGDTVTLPENAELFVTQTQMQTDMRLRSFRESYALSRNYGQIMQSDSFCYTLEDTARYWHAFCCERRNFGFFASFLAQAENQIHASAQQYEALLEEQLDAMIATNQTQFDLHPGYAEAIRAQIAQQNFIVAEDWMHRIRLGDFSLEVQQPEALGYLERFWASYADTYARVADTSRTLAGLLGRRGVRNKDSKGAQQLIDAWLSNGNPSNPERIGQLLKLLGWQNIHVESYRYAAPKTELYEVTRQAVNAPLAAPLHPIAAFGSSLDRKPMYVSCLYGTYDCDRLYEKIRTLDAIDGNKVILLDYALGGTDRRSLARKLKAKENGLRNVYLIIDRVLICHLADHYNENLINRILMATAMPFSYCQPYVVESVLTMPPEIFIGRKDELLKIEAPDGVNLIYGGRQLGKSALFKKALSDIDGHGNQRALLVDIKELGCAGAAKKLCGKLMDLGIIPDGDVTDDWDTLCRRLERRLRDHSQPISYFLLMLDEADAFIDDCAGCGYKPLVALKDIQQSLPGQFKFVLAGLHNIVRFNREVALGRNSVITHLPSLKITPFRSPEAQELLTVPLSYLGFSLPSKVTVSQILATVNYFPGLIQLYCKKLIESIRASDYAGYDLKKTPPYVITDDHLRRVMADREFVEQIHEKFEITLTLDQDQGSCYYPLTLLIGWMYYAEPSKAGYTAKDILRHARDLTVYPLVNLDEEKIDALLQELRDLNILRSVSNDSYLLASKNFRDLLGTDVEIFDKLTKVGGAAA